MNRIICSVVILNYYGEFVIKEVLESLIKMNYSRYEYEIIVVDNNSKDNSKEVIEKFKKKYSNIRTIYLPKNLGFSRGNNVGIKIAAGKYVCLLNNDCIVDKNWLKELVRTAEKNPKTFAVNSKILVYQRFTSLKFTIHNACSLLMIVLVKSCLLNFSKTKKNVFLVFHRGEDFYRVDVPYDPVNDRNIEMDVLLSINKSMKLDKENLKRIVVFEDKRITIREIKKLKGEIIFKIELNFSERFNVINSLDRIQNTGIMVFQDGYGRDIGAIVSSGQQTYEYDIGQYDQEREIYAACAAAVLYKKSILKRIGYLDETFFMYYEDVEICERARLRGYLSMYCPKAIVRHMHALSSKEWSPFFFYQVEKGRLLHVFYNFPIGIFLREYFLIILNSIASLFTLAVKIRDLINKFRKDKTYNEQPKFIRRIQIVRVIFFFLGNLPYLIINRIEKRVGVNRKMVSKNYLSILEGKWYLE